MREPKSTERQSSSGPPSPGSAGRSWGVWLLLAAHVGLLLLYDLGENPLLTLCLMAAGFVGLWVADRKSQVAGGAVAVLLIAAVLRLLLLPVPPTLSDDLLRYVWDGKVVNAGLDPYRLAPEAEELAPLRDDLWDRLPHRDVATVYPPLSQALFSIAARSPWPVPTLKALLALLDLLSCWALLGIARRLGIPQRRTVWYAWNPLVVVEVAGMGHVDALGVCAVVLTTLALASRPPRVGRAVLGAAAGVLAKLVPLLALPIWARHSRRPLPFLVLSAAVVVAALTPVVIASGGVPSGLARYGVEWDFNGPLFEPLWRTISAVDLVPVFKTGLDAMKEISGWHGLWNRLYPLVYPQLLAKLLLLPGLLMAIWFASRRSNLLAASGIIFSAVILCSATVYPWYLLWVLPFAALCRQPAWLALSVSMPLSYLPQLTSVVYFPWVYLLVWLPFGCLLVRWPRWSID